MSNQLYTHCISPAFTVLRFVFGVGILLLFQLLGSWLAALAHASVPGSVIGMMLLAAALHVRLVPMWSVRPASDFLVRHLALLYVPAGVALMLYVGLLREQWLAITVAALTSLVAVLIMVGITVQRLERRA
ncbi:MAG: CidA/LrgA family protein [Gemmatimonadaceae bacterium]